MRIESQVLRTAVGDGTASGASPERYPYRPKYNEYGTTTDACMPLAADSVRGGGGALYTDQVDSIWRHTTSQLDNEVCEFACKRVLSVGAFPTWARYKHRALTVL